MSFNFFLMDLKDHSEIERRGKKKERANRDKSEDLTQTNRQRK